MSYKVTAYSMGTRTSQLNEDTQEDYHVPTYKVNSEEVQRIRDTFADEALRGANWFSIDLCAMYVRKAFERAFKQVTGRTFHMQQASAAKDYEPNLLKAGFRVINIQHESQIEVGDVMIFQKTRHSPWGHIQLWTGRQWVSDYKQKTKYPDRMFLEQNPVHYRYFGH